LAETTTPTPQIDSFNCLSSFALKFFFPFAVCCCVHVPVRVVPLHACCAVHVVCLCMQSVRVCAVLCMGVCVVYGVCVQCCA
jgi:hypothetical protein